MYVITVPDRYGQTDKDRQTDRRLTVASPRSVLTSRGKKKWRCKQSNAICNLQISTISSFSQSFSDFYRAMLAQSAVMRQ